LCDPRDCVPDVCDEAVAEPDVARFIIVLRLGDVGLGDGRDSNEALQGAG
jgi:hypothetical protein